MNNKIAFVAKASSGKTTASLILQDYGFLRMALADPVKDVTVEMLNTFYQFLGEPPLMNRERLERDKAELRWLLQGVGTDLGRNYVGPDSIWIEQFLAKVKTREREAAIMRFVPRFVVDDLRFENEATALRANGFTIVRIVRDEAERVQSIRDALGGNEEQVQRTLAHPSETQVDLIEADITIANTSLEELERQVRQLAGWPSLEPLAA